MYYLNTANTVSFFEKENELKAKMLAGLENMLSEKEMNMNNSKKLTKLLKTELRHCESKVSRKTVISCCFVCIKVQETYVCMYIYK